MTTKQFELINKRKAISSRRERAKLNDVKLPPFDLSTYMMAYKRIYNNEMIKNKAIDPFLHAFVFEITNENGHSTYPLTMISRAI